MPLSWAGPLLKIENKKMEVANLVKHVKMTDLVQIRFLQTDLMQNKKTRVCSWEINTLSTSTLGVFCFLHQGASSTLSAKAVHGAREKKYTHKHRKGQSKTEDKRLHPEAEQYADYRNDNVDPWQEHN